MAEGEVVPGGQLESPEALREVILAQRRELDELRRENADVALLLDALDAVLRVEGHEDPFANVFAILRPVFRFAAALVAVERDEPGSPLDCLVATAPALVGASWEPSRFFDKVLRGRVTATDTSVAIAAPVGPVGPADPALAGTVTGEEPALYVPLGVRRRRGMMVLLRAPGEDGFDRRDIALARKFSLLASHALAALAANRSESERQRLHRLTEELKSAQATLAHRANFDELTGLPNRSYLQERVTRALGTAGARRLALAFIDLDGFKQVNDRYGHDVGDRLLASVARRIVAQIRSTDMLARISGDEFVLLLDPLEDDTALDHVVDRILAVLREPFEVDGIRLELSASIGVALHPEHGTDYDQLRRNADLAMYAAKTRTKGSSARFDPSMSRAAELRAETERAVRRAVTERRFRIALQPLVHLADMRIAGFEVLARREDDDGTLRPPADFIDVAADLGLLDDITLMLVDELESVLPALDACFGHTRTISLNVSARQAVDLRTMRRVLARLRATGCPERFVVEVTEDAYLHAGTFQRDVQPLLAEAGVAVSIDDFGTGYASLATLLDLTADELKVDRAFISGVDRRRRSQVILAGIAAAARALGIRVVAEGVETEAELAHVRAVPGIELGQGYLFAPPATPAELLRTAPVLAERLRALAAEQQAAS